MNSITRKSMPVTLALLLCLGTVPQTQGMKRPSEHAENKSPTKKMQRLTLYDPQASADLLDAAEDGNLGGCEDAIKRNADVNAKNEASQTPLFFACAYGHQKIVKLLLEKGADVNATDKNGWAPLHFACEKGHTETVKLLLTAKNIDVNATNNYGYTPLHFACAGGHTEVVKLLLEKGANVNAKDKEGWTPLHWACFGKKPEIVKLLLGVKDIDVNATAKEGWTPLLFACERNNPDIVIIELLLAKGADANAQNEHGKTPLHEACQNDHLKIAKLLLDKNADVNATDKNGWTPFYLACKKGNLEIVKLLVAYGAPITPKIAVKYAELIKQVPADIRLLGNLFTNPTPFAQSVEQKGIAAIDDMLAIAKKHDYKAIGRKLVELKINLQKAFGKGGLLERTPLPPELAKQIVAFFTDMNRKELVERKKPVKTEPKP